MTIGTLPAKTFADKPDQQLDREGRQERVRAVLLTYCDPKVKYAAIGMTAWEIAGKVLDVLGHFHRCAGVDTYGYPCSESWQCNKEGCADKVYCDVCEMEAVRR